jgi:hypothetical protein
MSHSNPVPVLVTYRPKEGAEAQMLELLRKHWPALDRLGLVTKTPARFWRAHDKRSGRSYFVEMFEWKDAEAPNVAHQTPEVMAVWEPMGGILEDMQIAHLEPLDMGLGAV